MPGTPTPFYDAATGDLTVDYDVLRREMEQFPALGPMKERKQRLSDIAPNLPRFEKDLVPYRERMASAPDNAPGPPDSEAVRVDIAIFLGEQKFSGVQCPVLAIYADPHSFGDQFKDHPDALEAAQDKDRIETSNQAEVFSKGNPQAVVIRIQDGDHFIFRSNKTEVEKAIDSFVGSLPHQP